VQKRLPTILCLAGISAVGCGLWWLHPAVALVALGGLATALGIDQHRRNMKEAKK
jgi:hypothetical protein